MNSIELILQEINKEREEQKWKHEYSLSHDKRVNANQQLRKAAIAILNEDVSAFPSNWNKEVCRKMISKPYRQRVIIAATLLVAELDRTDPLDQSDAE